MRKSGSEPLPNISGEHPISFLSGDLLLEGRLHLISHPGQPGLVLCAPHPLYGGTMQDARITAIISSAITRDFNALRFNFRGVGQSQGSYGQGPGEVQDAFAAVQFLRSHPYVDGSRIALIGYSFGGSIALAAALNAQPAALVTLSASLRLSDTEASFVSDTLRYIQCPCYILHGTNDEMVSYADAEGIYAQLQVPDKYLRLIKGADHFYTKHIDKVIPMILAFIADKLL